MEPPNAYTTHTYIIIRPSAIVDTRWGDDSLCPFATKAGSVRSSPYAVVENVMHTRCCISVQERARVRGDLSTET